MNIGTKSKRGGEDDNGSVMTVARKGVNPPDRYSVRGLFLVLVKIKSLRKFSYDKKSRKITLKEGR